MIRRPPRSTLSSSSAASDVYKRQLAVRRKGERVPLAQPDDRRVVGLAQVDRVVRAPRLPFLVEEEQSAVCRHVGRERVVEERHIVFTRVSLALSLIHISEPTRPY